MHRVTYRELECLAIVHYASGQTICFVGGFRPVVGMPPAPHISLATATPDLPVFPGRARFPTLPSFTPAHSKPSPPVGWGSNPPCHACMRQSHRRLSLPNESRQHAPDPILSAHTRKHTYPRRSPHRPDLGAAAEYSHHPIPLCTEKVRQALSGVACLLGRTTCTLSDGLG